MGTTLTLTNVYLHVLLLSIWSFTLTSTSGISVLRTCVESQSNEERNNQITIPNFFMSTNQTTTFETIHKELKCQNGVDELISSTNYPLLIRPSGYVSILSSKFSGNFYNTDQYCIHKISETELQIKTCQRICSESQPCINKCCPPDKIYNALTLDDDEDVCVDPGNVKYSPRIYATSSDEIKREISIWYSFHPIENWILKCPKMAYHFYAPGKAVADALSENHTRRYRIQTNGEKLLWNSYARRWELLENTENYCIDGIFYETGQIYKNTDEESFMMICRRADEFEKETELDLSYYYGILYISMSWFALITVFVYALLWEKQNIHGWTIMSYCVAVFFWFIHGGFSHLTRNDFEQTTFCTFSGTMAHFFVIATFCWLALISFDLWNTFSSLSVPKRKGVKKFIFYSVFGWGIPLILISFSWSMELAYRNDDTSEVNIPRYGVKICNISKYALGLYVYLPFGILMLANMILFSLTTWKLIQIKRNVRFATENLKKDHQSYALFFKLFIVTGFLWIFDIISWLVHKNDAKWYWAIFDSLNGFSPFFIFVIFICKRDIIKSLNSKYSFLQCILSPILKIFDRNKGDTQTVVSTTTSHVESTTV